MDEDEKRRSLETVATLADELGAEHRGHEPYGCDTARVMGQISGSIRQTLATSRGPAQVASPAYRENWNALFGSRQPVGQA
jgi:hypothetical protein